jgi:hypothetical protein
MAFASCGRRDDPFTRQVREIYRANVVSAPRAGIDPLHTLAVRNRRVEPRGRIEPMLDGAPLILPTPDPAPVADLAGVRSAAVDLQLGVSLSATFLAALGAPVPGADVTASLWQGASGFTFEVHDVVEHQMDIAQLGQALQGRRIVRNAATAVFFAGDGTQLYLITRTLTSPSFSVRATRSNGQSIKVAVDGVADLLGQASAAIAWHAESDDSLNFRGSTRVTFAFAAVPCALDNAGNVVFGLTSTDLTFGTDGPPQVEPRPVVDAPGLVGFDDPRAD